MSNIISLHNILAAKSPINLSCCNPTVPTFTSFTGFSLLPNFFTRKPKQLKAFYSKKKAVITVTIYEAPCILGSHVGS